MLPCYMLSSQSSPSPSPSPDFSYLCARSVSAFNSLPLRCHPERSEGSAFLCPCTLSLDWHKRSRPSPFPATLTNPLQITENKTTLSLVFATLTRLSTHKPFVCHSCEKHPGSHLSSQRSFRSGFSRPNFLPTPHSPLATKLLRIRTYEKRACNSRRIRTCKTQDLKPFRIRTYEKTRGEGPHLLSLLAFAPSAIIIGLASPSGSTTLCPLRTFRTHDAA